MHEQIADSGDQISKHYAGTGATTSKATKQGNIGIMGFLDQSLKGIDRFYKGNFEDSYQQECLDFIIGRNNQCSVSLDKSIFQNDEELKKYQEAEQKYFQAQEHEYKKEDLEIKQNQAEQKYFSAQEHEQKNEDLEVKQNCIQDKNNIKLNLLTITWNTHQFNIQDQNKEEIGFLSFERSIPPDFIFFTFQNINTFDNTIQGFWFQLIQKCIMQFGQEYKMVSFNYSQNSKIRVIAYVLSSLPYQVVQLQIDEICSSIFGDEQKIYVAQDKDNEKRIQLLNQYMKNIFIQNYTVADNQQNQYQDLDNIQYQIQSYQQHEGISKSNFQPVSFSIVFNLPKQLKDSQNIYNQKYLNQEQKVFIDEQNAPRIFEFFKPPQAQKFSLTKLKYSRSGQENTESNSLSLDASVTMIIDTYEEDQDEQSQNERYTLLQNILNENNQFNEQESSIKKSQNSEQELYQLKKGQQFQLPLIKDYINSKQSNQEDKDKKYLKQSQNNSLKNLQSFEINQKEDEETEDQAQLNRHRKMSSFDICFIEDKLIPKEKKVLQVIKEE
ncbi:hypothetical protein ABPG74_010913 [Tetrahymena malaccensis]